MEMDFQAYLASSDEECSNKEVWPAAGKGSKNLTEKEKIANYRVRVSFLKYSKFLVFRKCFVHS